MILHTSVLGSGEPILFLHTGLQTGLTDFEYQQKYFSNTYKILLPDLRGHGLSVSNDFESYFENSAHDILDTLKSLNISKCHIVGCSIGAIIGFHFAKMYPELVRSLTLSGIMPIKPDNWNQINEEEVKQQQTLINDINAVSYFNSLHNENSWRSLLNITKNNSWYPFQVTSDVSNISSPVMIIVGEGNKNETRGAIYYQELLPEAHIAVIPFASHQVHNEEPEIYSKILESFLSSVTNKLNVQKA
jgi:pimeloyl-ACP methyl ester carboxylesterase